MERLTERTEEGQAIPRMDLKNNGHQRCMERLAEYEDLEEQGRLLKLPCAVGDTVYAYCSMYGILEYEVDNIVISKDVTYQCSSYSEPIGDCPSECLDEIEPDISDFGRTVFLTRTEAERINEELLHVKYKIEEVIDAIVQADNEIICAIQHRDREGLEGALKDYLMRK